jgi:pyruvate kinase
MVDAGLDLVRLNFSHGTRAEHELHFRRVKELGAKTGRPIGVIGDLQGPKIRIGELEDASIRLRKGADFTITTRKIIGSEHLVSTTYRRLHEDVGRGDRILVRDGAIELRVVEIDGRDVHCRVVFGGELTAHAGINLPGIQVSEPSLTRKDREDVRFAVGLGVDYLALSFVRSPADVLKLKRLLKKLGANIHVIAKIEKPEAVERIDGIISAADGIMIARGDLGVEMPPEKVPQIQKDIITRCTTASKPVITATQMLESMITKATPTRAEASDVVNAIYDGADAVMLSGETAVGANPARVIRMMARMAEEADGHMSNRRVERGRRLSDRVGKRRVFEAVVGNAVGTAANFLSVRLVVCFTSSGFTAMQVSSERPKATIIGATQHESILPRMSLYWGVEPMLTPAAETIDDMIENIERELLKKRMARKGDSIIVTTGYPLGVSGTTNMMQLVRVGDHPTHVAGKANRGKRG